MKIKLIKEFKPKNLIIYSAVILLGIFLDQLTKWLAVKFLKPIHDFPLIKDVLHLTYFENDGAAFGMFSEPDQRWIFMTVSTVAIVAILLYIYLGHAENMLYGISLAMIASGGIGNMIDRIALGTVVDFINFELIDFAIFNGADSFVCVGAGMLILACILDIIKETKAEKKE